jgi:hypothetical protein
MNINVILEILMTMGLITVGAVLNAFLSYFLDHCFGPGQIFGRWLPWLATRILRKHEPDALANITPIPDKEQRLQLFIEKGNNYFLFKILGGCIVCANIWLGFVTFQVFFMLTWDPKIYYYMLPYLLISSFVLRKSVGA